MSFSKVLFTSVIAALLLASCGAHPAATTAAPLSLTATLSEVQGTVEFKNPDQTGFSAASNGTLLQVQGQVRTAAGSRARLDLSTGTIFRVAPESLFTLQSNTQSDNSLLTRLKLEAGQVWVILRGGQMQIETPSGVASVRGSYMSVWVDPGTSDVWVTCLEGWCQAQNPTAALDMIAGEGASLYHWDPAGTTPPPPPNLRYLTQEEINQFLANNPEAQQVMNSIVATASALPTLTLTTTTTSTATPTATATATPTGTPSGCIKLLTPANGADFSSPARIDFTWTSHTGAYKYILSVKSPTGSVDDFTAWTPNRTDYFEAFPEAGAYQWWVTVKDRNIQDICTSEVFTFTKPVTVIPTKPSGGGDETGSPAFWGQSGPKGEQDTCGSLDFSVSTSLAGTIKVVYGPDPSALLSPQTYDVMGEGPGPGSIEHDFSTFGGQTVYYIFAVNNDGYIFDTTYYSFTCPAY
jgi:hypothetical protein